MRGDEGGYSIQSLTVVLKCSTEGVKSSFDNSGPVTDAQARHCSSRECTPSEGEPIFSDNQPCACSDCSSHCSRSLASYALTDFQSPKDCLFLTHLAFPFQFLGVTKTKFTSDRSGAGMALTRAA